MNQDTQNAITILQTFISNKTGEIDAVKMALEILNGTFASQATILENTYKGQIDSLKIEKADLQKALEIASADVNTPVIAEQLVENKV